MKNPIVKMIVAAGVAAGLSTAAQAADQGITDTEIIIGSNQDMSGIFAGFGAPAMTAAQQVFDRVNAAGGIHGRTIKLIVEDHGYQLPKAMQGWNKLINSDGVFLSFMSLGTPVNVAGFKLMEAKNVISFLPLSAARQMSEPPIDLRYVGFSSYYDQMKAGIEYLAKETGAKEVCAMYLPSDFGKEIQQGTQEQAEAMGLTYKAETTHKGDDADFVGSLTKLKEEGCDIIATALGIRQTITVLGTAKKIGWTDVAFIGSSAAFHTAVAKVPGGITEGYYAAAGWVDLEARAENPAVKAFIEEYKGATGEFPGTGALLGRSAAETLVKVLEGAGRDLSGASFRAAAESLSFEDEIAGVKVDYSPADHQGGDAIIISKIEGGGWKEIARID